MKKQIKNKLNAKTIFVEKGLKEVKSKLHSFISFSIIIKQFKTKILNIKKIKKRKKQHNVRR